MASWTSEDLNQEEIVSTGPTRLNGWSLTNTGTQDRFVGFKNAEIVKPLIVVPPGKEVHMSGLDEPFPEGLSVESLTGDGVLIANILYEKREPIVLAPEIETE